MEVGPLMKLSFSSRSKRRATIFRAVNISDSHYGMKTQLGKLNRNDRSWKHRSYRVCHFRHGLEEGHGEQRAARALRQRLNAGGFSGSRWFERPLSRLD
jgi:hypothetical protein